MSGLEPYSDASGLNTDSFPGGPHQGALEKFVEGEPTCNEG